MSLVKWTEADSIGHPVIDAEHEALAVVLNGLHELVLAGADEKRIDGALEEVLGLLRSHFASEAKLMADSEFPEIGLHLDEHSAYLDRIEDLRRVAAHAEASSIAETFFLLRDWFVAHTRKDDRALANHLKQQA